MASVRASKACRNCPLTEVLGAQLFEGFGVGGFGLLGFLRREGLFGFQPAVDLYGFRSAFDLYGDVIRFGGLGRGLVSAAEKLFEQTLLEGLAAKKAGTGVLVVFCLAAGTLLHDGYFIRLAAEEGDT